MSKPAKIAIFLLALALGVSSCTPAPEAQTIKWNGVEMAEQPMAETPEQKKMGRTAWKQACAITQYRCRGLDKPQVVWSDWIPKHWEALGIFMPGESNVYVRRSLGEALSMVVLVHEITHYLQDQTNSKLSSCAREAEAFATGDKYATSINRTDLVRGPTWWEPYPRCQNNGTATVYTPTQS